MRVAILHYTAPPVAGGVENIIGQHAKLMVAAGHDVTIVAGRGGATYPSGLTFVRIPLLAVTHPTQKAAARTLAKGRVPGDFEDLWSKIGTDLMQALKNQDVIIAHNVFTFHFNLAFSIALAHLAAGPLSGRFVAWTHDISWINPLYENELHPGYPWQVIHAPVNGVHYVCVSETRRGELRNLWVDCKPKTHPEVIPNGVDPVTVLRSSPPIAQWVKDFQLLERDLVLLLPARITRRKNIELAIEAAACLVDRGVNATLIITGPTQGHHPNRSVEYLKELRDLSERLAIQDRVRFAANDLGRNLRNSEVYELLGLADILLLPSRSEGFGLPLLEAALNHLPMALSDLPVFREIAGDRAAYFPPDATAESVAQVVSRLASDGPWRLKNDVLTRYAWDGIYKKQITPLLQSVASQRRQMVKT